MVHHDKKWVFGCKNGLKVGRNPLSPTLAHSWIFAKTPLFSQFKGGGKCFLKRALRQSRETQGSFGHTGQGNSMGDWICWGLDLRIWGAPSLAPDQRENACLRGCLCPFFLFLPIHPTPPQTNLVDVSDTFDLFLLGGGKGEAEAPERSARRIFF